MSSDDNEFEILVGRIGNRGRRESFINEVLRAQRQAGVEVPIPSSRAITSVMDYANGPRTWFRPSSDPRREREIRSALEREVEAERWTSLDAAIRMAADDIGFIATCGRTIRARVIRRRAVSSSA